MSVRAALALLGALVASLAAAADFAVAWTYAGPAGDAYTSSTTDALGNVYVLGTTGGSLPTGVFVSKITPAGLLEWRTPYTIAGRYFFAGQVSVASSGIVYASLSNAIPSGQQISNSFHTTLALNPNGTQKWVKHYQLATEPKNALRIPASISENGTDGCAVMAIQPSGFPVALRYSVAGVLQSETALSAISVVVPLAPAPAFRFVGGRWVFAYSTSGVQPFNSQIVGLTSADQVQFSTPFRTDGSNAALFLQGMDDGSFIVSGSAQYGLPAQVGALVRYSSTGTRMNGADLAGSTRIGSLAPCWYDPFEDTNSIVLVLGEAAGAIVHSRFDRFAGMKLISTSTGYLPIAITGITQGALVLGRPSGPPYDKQSKLLYKPGDSVLSLVNTFGDAANPEKGSFLQSGPDYRCSLVTYNSTASTYKVRGIDRKPTAVGESARVIKGGTVNINVMANDLYAVGLLPEVVNPPSHGSAAVQADGKILYTPVSTFVGSDSFTYRVTRGAQSSPVCTVSITIKAPEMPFFFQTPAHLYPGMNANMRINLSSTASVNRTVTLTSSYPAQVSVPATVVVPAGSSAANFIGVCGNPDSVGAILTAKIGTVSTTQYVFVTANDVKTFSLASPTISDTGSTTGTVTMQSTYGSNIVAEADASWIQVPQFIFVTGGSNTFGISANTSLTSSQVVTIRVRSVNVTKTASLTVTP